MFWLTCFLRSSKLGQLCFENLDDRIVCDKIGDRGEEGQHVRLSKMLAQGIGGFPLFDEDHFARVAWAAIKRVARASGLGTRGTQDGVAVFKRGLKHLGLDAKGGMKNDHGEL